MARVQEAEKRGTGTAGRISPSRVALPAAAPRDLEAIKMALFVGLLLIGSLIPTGLACDGYASVVRNCAQCAQNTLCEPAGDFFWCICKEDYEGDGLNCTLKSLCTDSSCCPSGYFWNNVGQCCSKPDLCSNPNINHCDPRERCTQIFGHYTCSGPVRNNSILANCNGQTCSSGEDCRYLPNGSIGCVDPCMHHEELEENWRADNYRAGAMLHEDYNLHGWYHFAGESGSKMLESCQSSFFCGTGSPITLQAPHPPPEHGIVLMDGVTGSRCSSIAQIYVKACPENFFVYKFMGLYYPGSGYCTDHSSLPVPTCCSPCAQDEECRVVDHTWDCHCKEVADAPSDTSQLTSGVTCGDAALTVTLSKCLLERLGLRSHLANPAGPDCAGHREVVNGTSTIRITWKTGECGTRVMRKNETHVTFSNTLYLTSTRGSPASSKEIPLSCDYPFNMQYDVELSSNPVQSSVTVGDATVTLALFKNDTFTDPYEEGELLVRSDMPVYVGVYIQNGMWRKDAVVMKNCYSTPSANPGEMTKHFYIQDRCPNGADPSVTVTDNGKSHQAGFAGILFAQNSDEDSAFLHCAVQLCTPTRGESCVPICPPRSPTIDFTNLLTIGPIQRTDATGIVPNVTCDLDGIVVSVSWSAVQELGYDTIVLPSYQDPQCIGSPEGSNQDTITVRTPFLNGECGVQFSGSREAVNVLSTVRLAHLVSGEVANPDKRIPFSCAIPLHKLRMSHIYMESKGNESAAEMSVYLDTNFTILYPQQGALALHPREKLYVKVKLTGASEPDVTVELRTCYATPSLEDDTRILLIQDGTPVPGPIHCEIIENRNSNQARFAFTTFEFMNGQDCIYLHCSILQSMKSSGEYYLNRVRRSAPENTGEESWQLSYGPIW
ncbi:uromodulin-like [Rhinatrema bivittatum]|uniref:uromodulin-like n=1 Tax=Rhinatrema bivittatum TaxID=194408 RepID=UPI00112A6BF7|nr:uromodulin-like [Rhinatrema bivittatum]